LKKLLLITCILCNSNAFAINPDITGCESKENGIEALSFMQAMFQSCGFDKQPKQKIMLQNLIKLDNEQCNFSAKEITLDQKIVRDTILEIEKKKATDTKGFYKTCEELSGLLQQSASEYEESKKPKYKVGGFNDPNIPAGYIQQCQMHYGRLQKVADMYDDVYFGKMPMALADQSLGGHGDMSTTYPYNSFQLKTLEKKIKSIVFSKKDHEKELYDYLNNFEYQCLKDIAEFDKKRSKRNSYHNYSQD
jgi:hypothetical protein